MGFDDDYDDQNLTNLKKKINEVSNCCVKSSMIKIMRLDREKIVISKSA